MLKKLTIENFRCFKNHSLDFKPITLLVGKNNAGKSTVVESLRIISLILRIKNNFIFRKPPKWADFPSSARGVSPSIARMGFNHKNIFHAYGNHPSIITAFFENGNSIKAFIGPNYEIYGLFYDRAGKGVFNIKKIRDLDFPSLDALPQLTPLDQNEPIKDSDYVVSSMHSILSSKHFRNQIKLNFQHYPKFKELSEKTWKNLQIDSFNVQINNEETPLSLLVRDGSFVSEVSWMGHGLQMWLQTMWFLSRTQNTYAIILDEPDVYMHADLQRRLVKLILKRYPQVIIATHSIEIMSEIDPNNILVVNKDLSSSQFATSLPGLQETIDAIGTVHNIQLTRLWNSNKCVIVEGSDLKYLKKVYDKIFPSSEESLDYIPHFSIGGWGGWEHVIGSTIALKNTLNKPIHVYCLFDSDYHSKNEIEKRKKTAKERGINLHIFKMKEIENYFIIPEVISRLINTKNHNSTSSEIEKKILEIANNSKSHITDLVAQQYFQDGIRDVIQMNQTARDFVETNWASFQSILPILPGKEILKQLSIWSKQTYGVPIDLNSLIDIMSPKEVNSEIQDVLKRIQENKIFQS